MRTMNVLYKKQKTTVELNMKDIQYYDDLDPKANYEARVKMLNRVQPFYLAFVGVMFLVGAFNFGF